MNFGEIRTNQKQSAVLDDRMGCAAISQEDDLITRVVSRILFAKNREIFARLVILISIDHEGVVKSRGSCGVITL